ncbi:hypothetical protein EBR43_07240 [bacterium]|nr:hypothetical protein [bacterium]NBX71955.1 hypothetical protein [bacterium]
MKEYDTLTFTSPHFHSRESCPIKGIITHSMGCSVDGILKTLVHPKMEVSAHYVVSNLSGAKLQEQCPDLVGNITLKYPERAPVIQVVHPQERAWHAGCSQFADWNDRLPGCARGLNSCTIGIEFAVPGYGAGGDLYNFVPFNAVQAATGIALIQDLVNEYDIPSHCVLAHSTIAPGRKTDPGPLFFWKELNDAGLGYLPTPVDPEVSPTIEHVQQQLYSIGFISCPQNGLLDQETQDCIDAYRKQFVCEDWQEKGQPISDKFIASLNGFVFNNENESRKYYLK